MKRLALLALLALSGPASAAFAPDVVNTTDSNTTLRNIPTNAAAKVLRLGFAQPHDAGGPLLFKASPSPCSLNAGDGDGGSQVKSGDGKCWLAQWPGGVVDVRQYGADATGAADASAAARTAFNMAKDGQPRKYVFPPGRYLMASWVDSPYPTVTGKQGFALYCTAATPCKNVTIEGYGAVITADAAHANSNWMAFDYMNGFVLRGFTFEATPASWAANSLPGALYPAHWDNFVVEDIQLSGNWGGGTRSPFFASGTYLTNGNFNRIKMPQAGGCYDMAFMRNVSFTNHFAQGAGDDGTVGTAGSRVACMNIEDDLATRNGYPAAATFIKTTHVTFAASNSFSWFSAGIFLRAGSYYTIAGHLFNNPGTSNIMANSSGAGVLLYNDANTGTPCCLSTNDPVHDVTISGAVINLNGTSVTGAGVLLDGTSTNAGEGIKNVNIIGNVIDNNKNAAVKTIGANVSGVVIGSNALDGFAANQTTGYDAATLLSAVLPFRWQVPLGSGVAITPGATQYLGVPPLNSGQANVWLRTAAPQTLKALACQANSVPGASQTYTLTVMQQGNPTTNTCVISGASSNTCSDTTHSVAYAASDVYNVRVVSTAGAAASNLNCTVDFTSP